MMRQSLQNGHPATSACPHGADLLEQLPDALIVTDLGGTICQWSGQSEDLFGYSADEAVGQPVTFLVRPSLRRRAAARILRATRETGGFRGEMACIKKDGTEVWIETTVRTVRDAGERPVFLSGICRDISGRAPCGQKHPASESRTEAETAMEPASFMNEVSAILGGSLDYTTTLQHIARVSVPLLADYCIVDAKTCDGAHESSGATGQSRSLIGFVPDPRPIEAAVAHCDARMEPLLFEMRRRYPMNEGDRYPAGRVLASGLAELWPAVAPEMLAAMASDSDHADLLRRLAPVSMMAVPLAAHGRILGCMWLVRLRSQDAYTHADMTRAELVAKRAALALDNARLYREAQEANRARDEFLGTVSHELRTPLNAILGWARILRTGRLNQTLHSRALATIERNAMLQARLIEDLLDASRIVVGKLRMERRAVDLVSAVRAALEVVRPSAEVKSVALVTSLDRSPVAVMGDLQRLQQIFWNLLSNAVKFTPSGGAVDVRIERTGSEAVVAIRDTGEGIRREFLPHAFERFRQGDSTTTRRHGGLGLGLAIVQHLVDLHGGSVRAESEGPGRGATFTVTLPLAPAGEAGVVLVERITPVPGDDEAPAPAAG